MSSTKKFIADLLFGVQIVCAIVFCGAYALRSLTDVTGSSIAQFGLAAAFLVFNLALGVGAHRAKASRGTRQTIATYIIWLVLVALIIIAAATNPSYEWNEKDTATIVMAGFLTIGVLTIGGIRGLPLADPTMKALFGIAYKAVPQVLLAWKFLAEGASGTPAVSVVMGHATILIRLGQIYFMVREAGWDRYRFWLAVSEGVNEASWVVATIAWLIV